MNYKELVQAIDSSAKCFQTVFGFSISTFSAKEITTDWLPSEQQAWQRAWELYNLCNRD